MSNELIPSKDELQAIEIMSKHAVDSKFFQSLGGYAGVFSIAMYARELGLPIMQCLFGGMSNVLGKIQLSPQMMNSMIRKAGHRLDIDSNDQRCIIKGTRKDTGEVASVTFSVEDAKKAQIYKDNGGWAKYPSDMCFARALSRIARRLFPDVIGTAYVEGEIQDEGKPLSKERDVEPITIETDPIYLAAMKKEQERVDLDFLSAFIPIEKEAGQLDLYVQGCTKGKNVDEFKAKSLADKVKFAEYFKKWVDKQPTTIKPEVQSMDELV